MVKQPKAVGDCFRWAYHYQQKHRHVVLHQGLIVAPHSVGIGSKPFPHAWVVDDGLVKDWQTMVAGLGGRFRGTGYPEGTWTQLWQPKAVKSYTIEQSVIALAQNNHYGPWG